MSFALSVDGGRLEWASHSLDTIFTQRGNVMSPSFLAMIRDVLRFGREGPKVLDPEVAHRYASVTLGEYLTTEKYSSAFIDNYVLPMCAAVWSVPASQVLKFPVTMLIRFWANHHLLDITQRPVWRVVKNRSREYVGRATSELPEVKTSTPILSVKSLGPHGPVHVVSADGTSTEYDAVVCATHSDVALKILGSDGPSSLLDVLRGVPYNDNDVWLHTDASLMPRQRKAWASWNCLTGIGTEAMDRDVCVSYWVNSLQCLPSEAPDLFVTLNPVHEPAPNTVIRRLRLAHPVFGEASVAAQARLPSVQGTGGIYLAGAWCGYGFHEDGILSAIKVLEAMSGTLPWVPRATSPKLSWIDSTAIRMFDRFAKASIHTGRLRLILPTGEELRYGTAVEPFNAESWRGRPPLDATLRIYDAAFFRKIISRHDTGLGESYMDGDYEVIPDLGEAQSGGDLGALIAIATANATNIESMRGLLGVFNRLGSRALHLAHLGRSNTVSGSRKNIEEHYDAGNAMYRLFLDDSMTYSCGIWDDGRAKDLYTSQMNKLDALIEKAGITAEHHVLEIGCGWGSFAIRAATKTGCRVTGLTLSKEQLTEATARVRIAGLADRVTLLLCDYRDCPRLGTYDRVVSCEMIEAVGQEHLRAYFLMIGAALKPNGRAVIQVIAEPDERYEAYCASSDFIREYIFPGGHLPSVGACVESARGTGMSVHGCDDIGPDYAVTLRAWRAAWEAKKSQVLDLGYSERFWRKYRFYFAYCEAAFDARYIHTFQMTWIKDGEPTLTDQDVVSAMERSKQGLQVDVPPLVASTDMPKFHTTPVGAQADALTQVLMYVYFFLAGAAVSTSRVLWLIPVTMVVSAVLYTVSAVVSGWLLGMYKALGPQRAALWNLQSVHLAYSSMAGACALLHLVLHPASLILKGPQPPATLPRAMAAVSAGFFGFVLWTEIGTRLYRRNFWAVVHYTLLLMLFSAAAHRGVNLPFLAVTLLSEINTAVLMIRRQAALTGSKSSSSLTKVLAVVDSVTFVLCRLIPHAALGAMVVANNQAFMSSATYWLACAGMAYMNAVNAKHGVAFLRGHRTTAKHHAL